MTSLLVALFAIAAAGATTKPDGHKEDVAAKPASQVERRGPVSYPGSIDANTVPVPAPKPPSRPGSDEVTRTGAMPTEASPEILP
jgi:hypothetical protein